ncbi:MAG: proton-conducting transporter membrane subunit [Candidatus Omnitrophota bacterium]
MNINNFYPLLKLDSLSGLIALAVVFFSLLSLVYSFGFMKGRKGLVQYYTYFILTALASVGASLANNLILLLILWGFLGLTLYLLINLAENASDTAKKTFIIIGGSDALMLLGIGIIYRLTGTWQMDQINLGLDNGLSILAYILIALASFAKAGAMPLHSWIPDCAEKAPLPVVAFLPASLDKLLGIYLLARISLNLFAMNEAMSVFLMLVGALTVIAAVMMALVQHNMKRLLGYHAVSQVGYMVLGIGTANPIGIAGGIFHMLNHAIYKSSLFLTSGNVESRTHTVELDKLGGLAKSMPLTYISCLIASLSISGIPPLNGFFSKLMVYQGVVTKLESQGPGLRAVGIFCLILALFGSGLTLASFMKLLHSAFLGEAIEKPSHSKKGEVSLSMSAPVLILSFLCVAFGIFAYALPLKYLIFPAIGYAPGADNFYSYLSAILVASGIIIGIAIFYLGNVKKSIRKENCFTGGEIIGIENKVAGTEFYNTIKDFGAIKNIYRRAESGSFDIYEELKKGVFGIGKFLQYLHNGVLPTYLVWTLLGMMGLFWALLVK